MTTTAIKAIEGTYEADQIHSVFGFSVVHNGISTYRGTLDDVSGTLRSRDGELELQGAAKVESISIHEPEEFRAHVLGEDFFDAAEHPEVLFRSSSIELALCAGSAPLRSNCSFISGDSAIFTSSLCSRLTISIGVPLGAKNPSHSDTSKPG